MVHTRRQPAGIHNDFLRPGGHRLRLLHLHHGPAHEVEQHEGNLCRLRQFVAEGEGFVEGVGVGGEGEKEK